MFQCAVHHSQEEVHILAQICQLFKGCYIRCVMKFIYIYTRLCGLVVRVSTYRYRGLGFDSRRYQIF